MGGRPAASVDGVPRLILLNGPPAAGKSTLARRWSDDHPGTLLLDIDLLRTMVSGWQEDLLGDTGWAHLDGTTEPVSIAAARHAGCAGVLQRVLLAGNGRILRIGTEERVFNKHQRRAIALRDGNCIIPGCGVPAAWCEIHHPHQWADGGPTDLDNALPLCGHHHRRAHDTQWQLYQDHNGLWRYKKTRHRFDLAA